MVAVPGGAVAVSAMGIGALRSITVDAFFIDEHEVTNDQYKRFVDAGGYQKREFWKQGFVLNGREISWEEALGRFRDSTGRPGPATWEAGTYPNGSARLPVAGISWFEAAAYATFAGGMLPTAFHWTHASQNSVAVIAAAGNFRGSVHDGGSGALSGYGTTDMAGNVKEWCLNEGREGKRFILGGGFGEPSYMFRDADEQSPWERRANFGVRTMKLDGPAPVDALARIDRPTPRDFFKEVPVSDEVFAVFRSLYAYDKSPLNPRIEESESKPAWTRERVTFDAAYGHERVIAHLFLPKHAARAPFQPVIYFPGGFSLVDDKLDLAVLEESLDFILKSGRALIAPIYKGLYERRDGLSGTGLPRGFYRDHLIMISKDVRRSLDYLETRRDIDATRIGYLGASFGGQLAPIFLAIEPRIKAAVLDSGGLMLRRDMPEVDRLNFVSRVHTPVLMLNGRFDTLFPLETSQIPLFRLLGTPPADKNHVIYEGGHGDMPYKDKVREMLDWFDKYLGAVQRD